MASSANITSDSLSTVSGNMADAETTETHVVVTNKFFPFLQRDCIKFFTFVDKVLPMTINALNLSFILDCRKVRFGAVRTY